MGKAISALSRLVAAGLMAAMVALPAEDARADGRDSWRDDDGRGHRAYRHDDRGRHRGEWRHHDEGRHRGWHHRPRPRVFFVPPPHVIYLASPRGYGHRVAAQAVSPVYWGRGGRHCRDYQVADLFGSLFGLGPCTACLYPDGIWRVVD